MKSTIVLLLLCCSCCFCTYAQLAVPDTDSSAISYLIQQYKQERGADLLLYNGIEYARAYPHTTGSAFLFSDTFRTETLIYDNVMYYDVLLNYDAAASSVVIKNKDNFLIELLPEKIGYFTLRNHLFVSLPGAGSLSQVIRPGIYEWYRFGTASVFVRHRRVILRSGNAADLDHFKDYNDLFVQNGTNLFQIKSNRDLLKVFADRQADVSSYLRQNNLTFKEKPEETVIEATAYYAQLKTK